MTTMWIMRAGKNTLLFNDFKNNSFVAVGEDIGDISDLSLDDMKFKLKSRVKNPDFTAGIIRRFRDEVNIDDYVFTPSSDGKYFLLGQIIGDIIYNKELHNKYSCYRRPVKWISKVYRNDLSKDAKQSLSAQITVFKVKDKWQKEIFNNQESLDFVPKPCNINLDVVCEDKKELNENFVTENCDFTKDKLFFKYVDLYKEGLLTKEEFEKKKKELL